MKGFFSWFNSRTKIKRWILLILIGVAAITYAFASILEAKILKPIEIVKIAITFVLGFTVIVIGLVYIQKRVLEILIEANNTSTEKGRKANNNIKSLVFNKKMYDEGPKVVVIGGGSGINTVIKGLKKYTNNITAVVTLSSYGQDEPMSSKELNLLPFNDIKESIIALSDKEELMKQLFHWKFKNSRLKNLNFGDIYLTAMGEIYENSSVGLKKSTEILNITGQVLPATLDDIKVCAELEDGTVVEEKDKIPEIVYERITRIKRIFISPSNCIPAPGVLEAISEADAIVIGPGSLYTNVLPNLLVKNVAKTIKESKALKIYITNIMTEPGQTDNFSISDHLQALFDHTGKEIIDYCIADTGEIVPEFIRKYNQEGQDVVDQDIDRATKKGIRIIQKNLSRIDGEFIRHDSDAIAIAVMELISNDLKYREKESTPEYLLINSILEDELKREKKRNEKIKKQKAKNAKLAKKGIKKKSKFQHKYKERIFAIQTADNKKIENQRLYSEMEKLEKSEEKAKKKSKTITELNTNKQTKAKKEKKK